MSIHTAAASGGERPHRDHLAILSGTTQNIVGIGVAAAALFVVQILMTRALGEEGYGVVTLLTQAAFVASFATRSGMDMAVLRDVAVEVGVARREHVRVLVARAALIALAVSGAVAIVIVALDNSMLSLLGIEEDAGWLVPATALGLPFIAVANVWLAATRGLKIMRYTLYVFWAGQNIVWIVLTLVLWQLETSSTTSVLAYSLSWVWAAAAAWYFWRKESRAWPTAPPTPGWLEKLLRYAGPRAPAALFAQLLFWTDLFVLTRFAGPADVGVYAAALRAGQIAMLFLTSVNLMFGPYVADLHNRGERQRLDGLYKTLTRWIVAATLPVFLVIAVAPGDVMRIFGAEFARGETALLILLTGQLVNIATGSAGFILIMVGRTGWDLIVYAGSLALDVALALWLCSRFGIEGAAVANAVTFAASNCARLLLVRRFVGIQPYDRNYLRLVAPACCALGAMWLTHHAIDAVYLARLLVTAGVGAIVYVAVYALVGLTPAERRGAATLLGRFRSESSART
jgi:O-antigen/teichoic acid export membrane protein